LIVRPAILWRRHWPHNCCYQC